MAAIFAFLLGLERRALRVRDDQRHTRTAAVALQIFGATQDGGALPPYGQLMAAALVCAVPVVALYLSSSDISSAD